MQWMFLIGLVTGCRTMTGIMVLSWAAHLGWFPVEGTWAAWLAHPITVLFFTLAALSEYAVDVHPKCPSRKSRGPAMARMVFGALTGAIAALAQQLPAAGGVLFGVLGAACGMFGGYWLRMKCAGKLGKDRPVGLAESLVVLLIAIGTVYVLHVTSDALRAKEALLLLHYLSASATRGIPA